MPITPRQRQTGNSTIDELIKFLGGDDPAQSMMDTVNPAVGMAKNAARRLLPTSKAVVASAKEMGGSLFDFLAQNRHALGRSGGGHMVEVSPRLMRDPKVVIDEPGNIRQRDLTGEITPDGQPGGTWNKTREQTDALKKDIAENGVREPIEIDINTRSGKPEIIEGTHRLMLAEELGMDRVPAILVPNSLNSHPDPAMDSLTKVAEFFSRHGNEVFFRK